MANIGEVKITLTTAAPSQEIQFSGAYKVDILGTFGSGTVTHFSFTEVSGRAEALEAATTTKTYLSECPSSEFVIAGSTGATVDIVLTPVRA